MKLIELAKKVRTKVAIGGGEYKYGELILPMFATEAQAELLLQDPRYSKVDGKAKAVDPKAKAVEDK